MVNVWNATALARQGRRWTEQTFLHVGDYTAHKQPQHEPVFCALLLLVCRVQRKLVRVCCMLGKANPRGY
jgi:hypothetical protein